MAGIGVEVEVQGLKETLAALDTFSDDLRQEALAGMDQVADHLARAIAGSMPMGPPLSNMTGYARGVSVTVGGPDQADGAWAMFKVRATNGVAAMADMAGAASKGRTPQGAAMVRNLSARYGRASRFLWPAARRLMPDYQEALELAAEQAAVVANGRLGKAA